jgi:hypothetical protein
MKHSRTLKSLLSLLFATALVAPESRADEPNLRAGRARAYEFLGDNSLEGVTSAEAIRRIGQPNVSPSRIWKLLEHGEKVECLSCIPVVAERLYDEHPKTREISAWWLRRRIFGVFGPGQIYSRVVATLNDSSQPEKRRAYAANAVGEFLNPSGIRHVANAAVADTSPLVRAAAVAALERLNHEGPSGELGRAISDPDENVRMTALEAAMSINVFSSVESVVARIDDESPRVRRRAAEALGAMRVSDAVMGLAALADPKIEGVAAVRKAAVWALGQIAEPAGKAAVEAASSDPDVGVRDAARIAMRRL